ncbi:unnamed protein product, partial [Coregonus sp. 'balchen']
PMNTVSSYSVVLDAVPSGKCCMNESPSTVIPPKMSKLQLLQAFFSDRLTTVAVEISVAAGKAFAEYQDEISRSKEENQRLQRLLDSMYP